MADQENTRGVNNPYVLLEHKSCYDRFLHLQLLEYMIKIWRLYIKQKKKKPVRLPIVIPLLKNRGICYDFGREITE